MPGNGMSGTQELFCKGGKFDKDSRTVSLSAGETASFETYFNLLSLKTYRKYCGTERVKLNLSAEGEYVINFYERKGNGAEKLLSSHNCNGNCSLPLAPFGEVEGYIYFTLGAKSDCKICGGSWEDERAEEKDVRIAVIICTYRREKFVEDNLSRVAAAIKAEPEWLDRIHFIVVDNARSLGTPAGDFYEIVPNRNLGGSGGFARGIYEAERQNKYTHYLLTDDDIRFDFSVLKRTWRLLCALTPEHSEAAVGGAMLVLERPVIEYEFGGKYDGLRFKLINSGLDMRETRSLMRNESAPKPDYNAWWYCCMPACAVKKHGLPMPFFIKGDDVEYGMRAAKEFILTSGIAVWHQDFAGKYTGILEYYIKRNLAVTSALHCKAGGFRPAVRFAYFMFKNLILKNYNCVQALYEAYQDFKRGPQFFLESDSEEVNSRIRRLAQALSDEETVEKLCGGKPQPKMRKQGKKAEFFRCIALSVELYLPSFAFSKRVGVTDIGNPSAADCFGKKTVVHYDRASGKGLVLQFDAGRRRVLRRAAYRVFFGLLFGYSRIKRQYRREKESMCSRENWERMFFKE